MNILFVLYHDFTANSASHVRSFAEELASIGHDCCVAVPYNKNSISVLGNASFKAIEFTEGETLRSVFSNGLGPDIVHAWTPREVVRIFCERIRTIHRYRLFVHLEDNEWHLLTCALGLTLEALLSLPGDQLDAIIPISLSHPRKAIEFMKSADGVTIIIDRLGELVPATIPTLELWPSADPRFFSPTTSNRYQRRLLGIPGNSTVLAYTGNVHYANAHEVRSLYLAVALLNREGFPTTLVRTGREFYPFLGPDEEWGRRHAIELGFWPYSDGCAILALADVLVQPGKPDEFNDYRFPSKVPEFLSVGRPVVLPNTNIAKHMVHRRHAYVLDDPSAVAIANAVREIISDPGLYATLSAGSLEFSQERLNWSRSALKLHNFYLERSIRPALASAIYA